MEIIEFRRMKCLLPLFLAVSSNLERKPQRVRENRLEPATNEFGTNFVARSVFSNSPPSILPPSSLEGNSQVGIEARPEQATRLQLHGNYPKMAQEMFAAFIFGPPF